jgi:restriction endonuclease
MKIQFNPNQQFQLDAMAAVTGLFDGQPQGAPEYSLLAATTPTGPSSSMTIKRFILFARQSGQGTF